eukprot:TRINITY_DN12187_c0_g1_i3.p1 TRINITY_DN12187_c0_g1~~TRINITY_DN12187_c0_g1_i3.p1  ORF type:complete len:356 (-),score=40.17 TRINITY_DN12187_c0_g1_i3:733-1800(-)
MYLRSEVLHRRTTTPATEPRPNSITKTSDISTTTSSTTSTTTAEPSVEGLETCACAKAPEVHLVWLGRFAKKEGVDLTFWILKHWGGHFNFTVGAVQARKDWHPSAKPLGSLLGERLVVCGEIPSAINYNTSWARENYEAADLTRGWTDEMFSAQNCFLHIIESAVKRISSSVAYVVTHDDDTLIFPHRLGSRLRIEAMRHDPFKFKTLTGTYTMGFAPAYYGMAGGAGVIVSRKMVDAINWTEAAKQQYNLSSRLARIGADWKFQHLYAITGWDFATNPRPPLALYQWGVVEGNENRTTQYDYDLIMGDCPAALHGIKTVSDNEHYWRYAPVEREFDTCVPNRAWLRHCCGGKR